MAFRIGRKFAQHTYPESRGLGFPPLSVVGFNAAQINFPNTNETVVATTSASLPFDGKADVSVQISFEMNLIAV